MFISNNVKKSEVLNCKSHLSPTLDWMVYNREGSTPSADYMYKCWANFITYSLCLPSSYGTWYSECVAQAACMPTSMTYTCPAWYSQSQGRCVYSCACVYYSLPGNLKVTGRLHKLKVLYEYRNWFAEVGGKNIKRERDSGKEGLGLCCSMTPGLSKAIRCHVWPYFFQSCKLPDQMSGHTLLVTGLSAWWLHIRYVWVNILTLSPRGLEKKEGLK